MATEKETYDRIIMERTEKVMKAMAPRVTPEELAMLREAAGLAREAHEGQKRKTGEPYILHPIAVAEIAAEELQLGAAPVMAAFLHDVVDTVIHENEGHYPELRERQQYITKVIRVEEENFAKTSANASARMLPFWSASSPSARRRSTRAQSRSTTTARSSTR